jgi:arylsulfatase
MPDKLKEMQALFQKEAADHQVLPLDNSGFVRALTARPSAIAGKTLFTYTGENANIPDGNAPNVLGKDFTISAELTIPSGGAEGVVVAEGGMIGGYGLYLTQSFNWWLKSDLVKKIGLGLLILGLLLILIGNAGPGRKRLGYAMLLIAALGLLMVFATDIFGFGRGRPIFVYNMLDLERFRWRGSALGEGKHTIIFDFKYDGPGVGKGGTGVLTVDGKEVDRKSMEHTIPFLLPADESFDVGLDTRTPVDFTYDCPFRFTGSIDKLTFNLGPSQLSAEDQRKKDVAIANANN